MKKKTIDKLEEITRSIPQEMKKRLYKTVDMYESTKELLTKALNEDSVNEKTKSRAKNLLDSGYLEKYETEIDQSVAKEIDSWVESKILEAIDRKELPKSNFVGLIRKAKQQAKQNARNTKENN